jgi:hypothetical protein
MVASCTHIRQGGIGVLPEPLLLVIDADIDNRVATELNARGRIAVATSELLLHRMKDEPLLRALVDRRGDPSGWVLVTGDDAMPDDHGPVLAELRVTLATVDSRRPIGTKEAEWRRDVIHRWAHAMSAQESGTLRRYSPHRHGLWRPRRSGRRR